MDKARKDKEPKDRETNLHNREKHKGVFSPKYVAYFHKGYITEVEKTNIETN